jgi:hypothetical protein
MARYLGRMWKQLVNRNARENPMSLGIKPTVDFVFKKVFGSPENVSVLIGLLNAILKRPHPIVHVKISASDFCRRSDREQNGGSDDVRPASESTARLSVGIG